MNYSNDAYFISNSEYIVLIERYYGTPFYNMIVDMNTTAGLLIPNKIINISSSTAVVNSDYGPTMLYVSSLDMIAILWCQSDTNPYCGLLIFS